MPSVGTLIPQSEEIKSNVTVTVVAVVAVVTVY